MSSRSKSIRETNKERQPNEFSSTVRKITKRKLPPEWIPDLELLRRVIKRTKEINDPRMDVFSRKGSPKTRVFKIATISTNLEVAQLDEMKKRDYRVWLVKDKFRKKLRREFLDYLRQAGEAGAKLVCFNELAYPTPLSKEEDLVFKKQIEKLVAQYAFSLIAGSYHDTTRFYNLSPVVAPKESIGQPHFLPHAKMTSAIRAYEVIRIPPNRHLRYYETEHGCFAVLICIDVYDPSLIFRLMMKNHLYSTEEKVDFIFVPSFTLNDAKHLAKACQDLSYATASLVVYVNCAADTPRHVVYLAGEEVKRSNHSVKSKVREISPNLQILTVTDAEYQRMRNKVSDSYSPVFDYLIGIKDGLRVGMKI